jgi:glycosyltransferase involved in cell wall biosynthesis
VPGLTKVVVLVDSLTSGGAERVSVRLAYHLDSVGVRVVFATIKGEEHDFYRLPDGIERRVIDGGAGRGRIRSNVRRVTSLRRLIRDESPAVVVSMMTMASVLAILAGLGLSARVVVSERNYPPRSEIGAFWALLRRLVYRLADAHVAQTRGIERWLRARTRARNVAVVPNPVAWPIASLPPERDPAGFYRVDDRLVVAVGKLHPQKGFDILIAAFAELAPRFPEWKLAIIGSEIAGPHSHHGRALESMVDRTGLEHRIALIGRVGNVGDWYERADLFVLPSRYEGFPNVLLEAMAAGCACIAADCETGPSDIIRDGFDGRLVSPEDETALAAAMANLMGSPATRDRFGARAKEVRERFSEARILGQWQDVLAKVVRVRPV